MERGIEREKRFHLLSRRDGRTDITHTFSSFGRRGCTRTDQSRSYAVQCLFPHSSFLFRIPRNCPHKRKVFSNCGIRVYRVNPCCWGGGFGTGAITSGHLCVFLLRFPFLALFTERTVRFFGFEAGFLWTSRIPTSPPLSLAVLFRGRDSISLQRPHQVCCSGLALALLVCFSFLASLFLLVSFFVLFFFLSFRTVGFFLCLPPVVSLPISCLLRRMPLFLVIPLSISLLGLC